MVAVGEVVGLFGGGGDGGLGRLGREDAALRGGGEVEGFHGNGNWLFDEGYYI